MAFILMALATVSLAVVLTGCGQAGPPAPKVDLKAQTDALKSPDKDTRMNAAAALATLKQGAVGAVPNLIDALKDPEPEVRRLAAYALMEIGPPAKAALPQLNTMTQDPDRSVVTQVINTIRTIDTTAMKDLDLQKVINQ